MSEDEPGEITGIGGHYVENTEEYERALSAILVPRGDRLSEIADRNEIDPDVLRRVARDAANDHRILIESDGERDDPRLYRNPVMGFFGSVWREFAYAGTLDALESRLDDLEVEIAEYRDTTGYDSPDALVDAINSGEDLSHIPTDDTGEVFWDAVTPWRSALHRRDVVRFVINNYDVLDSARNLADMDVDGIYGDFSDINAVDAKLGVKDQPPNDVRIDDEGRLHRPDDADE